MKITEDNYEGRAQYVVATRNATWWLDRAGGGLSRLIDPDGNDWIAFHKDPLSTFPASAAAGYRGIPNCLFGEPNPDAGGGHPGFDRCRSTLVGKKTIHVETLNGHWAWRWDFTEAEATLTMEKADPEQAWWFLYEGPVGGRYNPQKTFWGTDTDGRSTGCPDIQNQRYAHWRWAYFGSEWAKRVLFVARHRADPGTDNLWFLGNERGGAADSPDGMLVFGFGRGPKSTPLLRGAGHGFTVGLLPQATHAALTTTLQKKAKVL
jgi:hypothetical protein